MQHAALMGVMDGPGQGLDHLRRRPWRARECRRLLGQAARIGKLHHQKRPAVMFADLVDLHDVGMMQPGDGLAFERKRARACAESSDLGLQHLDGDDAIELFLPGLVNHAHAAASQPVREFRSPGCVGQFLLSSVRTTGGLGVRGGPDPS